MTSLSWRPMRFPGHPARRAPCDSPGRRLLVALSHRPTGPVGPFVICLLVLSSLSAVTGPSAVGTASPANFADLTRDPAPGNGGGAGLPGLSGATEQANPLALASTPVDYAYD